MPLILLGMGMKLAEYIYDHDLDWVIPVLFLLMVILLALFCK